MISLDILHYLTTGVLPVGTSIQYHELGEHVVFEHLHPPAIHDGHERLLHGVRARNRLVHVCHAWIESPYLQKAHRIRITVMLAR